MDECPLNKYMCMNFFTCNFWEVYIHLYNTYKNLDPFLQTPPNEVKLGYTSEQGD